jgi:AraC family transcriptional regulator
MGHVRRLRLERAAHRLKSTDHPVTRIAFEAGYETPEAFTRAFAAMFGESPSRFRGSHRPPRCPPVPSGLHFAPDGRVENYRLAPPGDSPLAVRIEQVPTMRVAFVRHTGPYAEAGGTWARLFGWAGPRGLIRAGAKMVGIVHDDAEVTPPTRSATTPVSPWTAGCGPRGGDVGVQEVGGEYAVATHRGPCATLGDTYARLCGGWLPASGREPAPAPALEVYRNSPQNAAPEGLLTDVHVPLGDS